jgi:hypothetical protein
MSLEHAFFLSQIIASIAVVASLIFVGHQVRENTLAIQRNEHNSTMEQWTVIRQAIARNREIAELMSVGLSGERKLDSADELRLDQMLQEVGWASFHIWDRTQRGIFPKGTFEATGGGMFCALLRTTRGGEWWRAAKTSGFYPAFVADVEAMLARNEPAARAPAPVRASPDGKGSETLA